MDTQNQNTNNINGQVERNEEFFKVRRELYINQMIFAGIWGLIFLAIIVTTIFAGINLGSNYITIFFVIFLIVGATLWEKVYKMKVLNKYDPKYKNVRNWS